MAFRRCLYKAILSLNVHIKGVLLWLTIDINTDNLFYNQKEQFYLLFKLHSKRVATCDYFFIKE